MTLELTHIQTPHQGTVRQGSPPAVVKCVFPGVEEEAYPQQGWGVFCQRLLDGDEVLEALAHLAAINVQVASVQEVPHL